MGNRRMEQIAKAQPWWKWPVRDRWEIAERYYSGKDPLVLGHRYHHDPRAVRAWLQALGIFDPERGRRKMRERAMRTKARQEAIDARGVKSTNFHPVRTKKPSTEALRRFSSCLLTALNHSASGRLTLRQIHLTIEAARWWGGTETWEEREEVAAREAAASD